MERIGIEQAAVEISGNCRGKTPPNTPYFFIVGAGLSASVVPQASRVIEMLQEQAAASKRQIAPPPSEDTMAVYGHWFRSVLNSRGKQREFLEELMRNVEISAENLRLALLLLDSKIGNIVVTPNFDDFLSRALTLFGNRHVISDNPYTSVRIRTESPEIQIVHVHGTYWFYDAANLQQDIKMRARSGKNGVTTTSDLLNHILRTHSPIVMGYSGWEQDVIMRALAIRLGQHRQFPLEYPLYWCCYNEKDVEQLPACIREHPNDDVRVVVPQSMLGTSKAKQTRKQEVSSSNVAAISSALRGLSGGGDVLSGGSAVYSTQNIAGAKLGEDAAPPLLLTADLAVEPLQRTLPARDVLSRLMLHTEVRAPQLLTDPAAYLSSHLRRSFPISSSPNEIIWQLTVQRLERSRPATGAGFADQLGELIFATLVSDFAAAIERGAQLDWSKASLEQLESYAHLMQECASGIYQHQPTESEDAIAQNSDDLARIGYEVVTKVYSALEKTSALDEGQAGRYLRSLLRHARVCDRLQRQDEALASSRKLIERFYDDSKDEASLISVCLSLLYVSADLFKKQSWDEALEILNKLAAKQVDTNDADLTVLFARASGLRGMLHLQRGELTASQTCFEKLISDFGNNTSPQIQAVVAQSMTGRAQALAQGGMYDEALKLYKEVIERYAHSQDSETINNVALAYAGAVNILAVSNEAEAIALAEQAERLVPKGIATATPNLSFQLLKFNLAAGFLQKGKPEQALAIAEKALESSPPVEADQRMQHDLMRLIKALALVQSGRVADGLPLIDDVIRENDKPTPLNELVRSVALLEKANFFIRQQDQPTAQSLLQELGTRYRTSSFGQVRQMAGRARWQRARMLMAAAETREEAINELKAIQSDELLLSNEQARGSSAAAAVDLGVIAQTEGRIQDAIDIFEQLAARGAEWTDLDSRLNVATAHWNAGFLLTRWDEFQRAKPHFEEVVKCAAAFRHPSTDLYHALSLRFLGLICATSDDMAGASEFLRQAEARAQDLPEPQRGDIIVSILLAKGVGFNVAGHAPEAIDSLSVTLADSELIKRQGASADIEIAFNMLTTLLVEQKQFDKAVEWTSRGIEWLTGMNRTLTPFHAQLAVRHILALQQLAKDDDALTVVAELLKEFHDVHDPETRNAVDGVFDFLMPRIIEQNDANQVETLTRHFLADFEPAIPPGRELIAAKAANLSLAVLIDSKNLSGAADRLAWMKERLGASEVGGVRELIEQASQTLEQSAQAPPKSDSQSA